MSSEIQKKNSWSEVLPFLFKLLVENADGIIDDTSLEKILEWLKSVCKNEQELQKLLQCGTVEFMASEQVFSNPESTSFFLRLFGFLVSEVEVFNSLKCVQDKDFFSKFLEKPKNEPNLWNEGIVRNGYFQALISLTEHKDGMLWLRNAGHIDCALDCISDRSMFVANSARSLIAKYLIREIEWIHSSNPDKPSNSTVDDKKLTNVTDRLRSVFTSESSASMLSTVAVIEVVRVLLCENSFSGQKVLQESKLFSRCLNLTKIGDATVCQKLADVVCEFAKNTRPWTLHWDKLFSTEEAKASDILLESCMDLFQKGLISPGLELVAGLGFCQGSSSDFPPHWLEVLFDVVEVLFELALNPSCQDNEKQRNGYHTVNEGENLSIGLADVLMSNDKQQRSFAKEQLQSILSPLIQESCSLTGVICQSLAAVQQLIQQASSRHCSHVLLWLNHSLGLVQQFINPNKQSIVELHGNQKVVKASLEFISSFTELQKSKDIFEDTESCTVNQLFHDVVVTLLQLTESSESSATVISSSLKTFGKVLEVARPEFLTELFSCETKIEEVPRKHARLDHSPSRVGGVQQVIGKAANSEKLAFVLYRRLRDSRWEVKDSTLEFVASVLQINNDSVHDFLCRHSVHVVVWNAIDDTDSYVRASAIHVIGSLACQSQLWASLLQTGHVTEESILEKLSSVLENDDEAFPRRRAMDCLILWLKTRHPMATRLLRPEKSCHPDLTDTVMDSKGSPRTGTNVELSSVEDAVNQTLPEKVGSESEAFGSQSEGTKTVSGFGVARSIRHACQDFDWEVKLRGLKFWEAVIDFFTEFKNNEESTSLRGKAKLFSGRANRCANDDESMKAGNVDELFWVLSNMGALNILSEALEDCDHMICEEAQEILTGLQGIANPERIVLEQSVKTSREFQESLGSGFGLEKFKEVLRMTDFPALIQSTEAADSAVRSDPVSLIEDILLAATRQDENLLDCY